MFTATERKKRRGTKLKWYISGPLIGIVVCVLLMLVTALLVEGGTLPPGVLKYLVIACVFLASAAAGTTSALRRGRGALETGLASGGIILFVILIATLIAPGGKIISPMFLKLSVASIAGGAFGGALCARRSGSAQKRSRRKR